MGASWKHPGWIGGILYAAGASLIGGLLAAIGRFQHWRARVGTFDDLPDGPVIVVANHTSFADGLLLAVLSHRVGRPARILTTAGVFRVPVLGWLMRKIGFIPVARGTSSAGEALLAAEDAIAHGEVIGIFPEGRLTRNPDRWPERAKTGAVRLALATGAPIVPVAFVGADQLIRRNPFKVLINLFRRPVVDSLIGDPINVAELVDDPDDPAQVRAASDLVMSKLIALIETLRGETAPSPIGVEREGD